MRPSRRDALQEGAKPRARPKSGRTPEPNVGAGHCPPFARSAKTQAAKRCESGLWKPRQSRSEGKVLPSDLLFIFFSPRVTVHATSTNRLRRLVQVPCTCSWPSGAPVPRVHMGKPGRRPAHDRAPAGRARLRGPPSGARAREPPRSEQKLRLVLEPSRRIFGWSRAGCGREHAVRDAPGRLRRIPRSRRHVGRGPRMRAPPSARGRRTNRKFCTEREGHLARAALASRDPAPARALAAGGRTSPAASLSWGMAATGAARRIAVVQFSAPHVFLQRRRKAEVQLLRSRVRRRQRRGANVHLLASRVFPRQDSLAPRRQSYAGTLAAKTENPRWRDCSPRRPAWRVRAHGARAILPLAESGLGDTQEAESRTFAPRRCRGHTRGAESCTTPTRADDPRPPRSERPES